MKFVLHHIPKTGGHSIVQSFRAVFGEDAVDVDNGDSPLVTTHGPAWRMFEDYPERAHITILRDPEERIKSYIRYMRGVLSDTNGENVSKLARDLTPSEFLRIANADVRRFTHNRQVRQLGAADYDDTDEPLAFAAANRSLRRMTWIGHTETLTKDLDSLFELVGEPNPGLPPQNVSPRPLLEDLEGIDDLIWWDQMLLSAWAGPFRDLT